MLTAPYVHFNDTRKPHEDGGRGGHVTNAMTMIDYTNLYIKNLDADVTSYDLFNRFRVYGKIISARVMKDNVTSKSKGYGFVSFTNMDEAREALQHMDGALVNTKNIVVTFHEHKKQVPNNNNNNNNNNEVVKRNSHDQSYPSPQSASYPNYSYIPEQHQQQQHHHYQPQPQPQHHHHQLQFQPQQLQQQVKNTSVMPSHNPWNETGIWMHTNKSPVVVPHHAFSSMHHVPVATTTTTTTNNGLVSPYHHHHHQQQQQHHHHHPQQQQQQAINPQESNINSQIQYQKLRDAIYLQLADYQQKDLNDLVDLIQSLKKRDLRLCLFNPTFLKQKIDEAYEALYLFQNNTTSMTTTPSLVHRNIQQQQQQQQQQQEDLNSTHSAAAAILTSLEGMTMNKKKRVFGDIFFPYVRATGVKHAPKVTIRLLDTVPLDELAFNMYDKKELTRKAQQAYSDLYC